MQKTQCDLKVPCGRCVRLDLSCTDDRPRLKRGRPRNRSGSNARCTDYTVRGLTMNMTYFRLDIKDDIGL